MGFLYLLIWTAVERCGQLTGLEWRWGAWQRASSSDHPITSYRCWSRTSVRQRLTSEWGVLWGVSLQGAHCCGGLKHADKQVTLRAFPAAHTVKNLPSMQETQVWPLGQQDPLEKGMATHSSIFAWRIPRTEEPGGLQSWGHKELDTTERRTQAGHTDWHVGLNSAPQVSHPGPTLVISRQSRGVQVLRSNLPAFLIPAGPCPSGSQASLAF